MNVPRVRGVCPGLSTPMQTGDGLLVRLMPAAPIPLDAMLGFCEAAGRHGNGAIEVSARGSLQVRGLTADSAPLFASAVAELGIAALEGVPVIAGFDLMGADLLPSRTREEGVDTAQVAAELRSAIANAGLALSPKVSVVVDGAGPLHLDALTADVRLRAAEPDPGSRFGVPRFHLGLGGDGASASWLGTVAAADVVAAVIGVLRTIAARGATARAAEILRTEGGEAFRSAVAIIEPAAPPPQRMPAEMIGLHSALDGTAAVGIGLAFGQTQAAALGEIICFAAAHGATAVRPAPDRALLLIGVSAPDALNLSAAAERLGFVVRADDPRRRIVACPGAPACAAGLIPARELASGLASALDFIGTNSRRDLALGTPSPQGGEEKRVALLSCRPRGVAIHISGCPKGCAHPMPTALTVVGTPRGCGIVRHGSAHVTPSHYLDPANLSREILRLAAKSKGAAHG
jgi:precorrin-3B synthase